jgi:hypothetical protein
MANIIHRFRGEHGQRLLRDALSRQGLLRGLDAAIDELTDAVTLVDYTAGCEIIQQDPSD